MLKRNDHFSLIADFFFSSYIFFSIIAERNIVGRISLLSFVVVGVICAIRSRQSFFSGYFLLELLFIIYCFIQNYFGISVNVPASQDMLVTLAICLIFNFSLYNYYRFRKDNVRLLEICLYSIILGVVVHYLINIKSLISGRLSNVGFTVLGVQFGAANSVGIAWVLIGALSLISILFGTTNIKLFRRLFILVSILILFSGTRKAIISIPIVFGLNYYSGKKKRNVIRFTLTIFLVIIISIILYFTTLKIDVLYKAIGSRLESLYHFLISGEISDGSLQIRLSLLEMAKNALIEKPVTGWGLDAFASSINARGLYSHNNYYEILVSGGIVGAIIFYSKYLFLLIKLFRKKSKSSIGEKFVVNNFLVLLILYSVLEYWQVSYYNRRSMMFFIIMLAYSDANTRIRNQSQLL